MPSDWKGCGNLQNQIPKAWPGISSWKSSIDRPMSNSNPWPTQYQRPPSGMAHTLDELFPKVGNGFDLMVKDPIEQLLLPTRPRAWSCQGCESSKMVVVFPGFFRPVEERKLIVCCCLVMRKEPTQGKQSMTLNTHRARPFTLDVSMLCLHNFVWL